MMFAAMTATLRSPIPPPTESDSCTPTIALLRGINVGGKNKLPMKDLAALFAAVGCTSVRTYIQSGNVVFRAPTGAASTLGPHIADAIHARFGLRVPVILRTGDEMQRLAAANPFLRAGLPEALLHVYFLADLPTPSAVKALDPDRSPGDTFVVSGRQIYLHLPNGVARTRLTNLYFDKALATTSTLRNWKTCTLLASMAADLP
jgi:uncharacterized protein (DUF1697 family)